MTRDEFLLNALFHKDSPTDSTVFLANPYEFYSFDKLHPHIAFLEQWIVNLLDTEYTAKMKEKNK